MKAIKNLLLVICLLLALSVAAYGGSKSISVYVNTSNTVKDIPDFIILPPGLAITWNVTVYCENEMTYSYTYAWASIGSPVNAYIQDYNNTNRPDHPPKIQSGSMTLTIGALITMEVHAEQGRDSGGAAYALAYIGW
jgi:hypothetical protein